LDEVDESVHGSLNLFVIACGPVRAAAGPIEWLTFPAPDDANRQFRVNVSFLLSNYRCIFGCGCPGILEGPARADVGCCAHGVEFMDDDDFDHVAAMVDELTAEDADHLGQIRGAGWYDTTKGVPLRTRLVAGVCIFANREGGPTGKPGCAFHHLALRTGRHPSETKPEICWSVPLNFSAEEPVEPGGRETTIVSAFSADAWDGHIGWWCVDTPVAYSGTAPVYVTFEHELRRGMGDAGYERMVELLEEIETPRFPMPAQRLPLISS
jgi:hypothetical protein